MSVRATLVVAFLATCAAAIGASVPLCGAEWFAQQRPLKVGTEWLLIARIQKTATKTVDRVLAQLVADSWARPSAECEAIGFSTSLVPTREDLARICRSPSNAACKQALSVPFAREDLLFGGSDGPKCAEPQLDFRRLLLNAAGGQAFVGSARKLELEFDIPMCSFGTGETASRCMFADQHHMSLPDLLSATSTMPPDTHWPENAPRPLVPPRRRLVVLLREPVSRVESELRHANGKVFEKSSLVYDWDYCFDDCLRHTFYRNASVSELPALARCFLSASNHSIGADNRQTKMLSGLVVAPDPDSDEADERQKLAGLSRRNWEQRALHVAMTVVEHAEIIMLVHRLPESIAFVLHRFDWVPRHPAISALASTDFQRPLVCRSSFACSAEGLSWKQLVAVGDVIVRSVVASAVPADTEDGHASKPLQAAIASLLKEHDALVRLDRALVAYAESIFNRRVAVVSALRDQMRAKSPKPLRV